MRKNDSEASVRTTALAESAGDCLSADDCMEEGTNSIIRRELSRSRLETARGRSRKRSVFFRIRSASCQRKQKGQRQNKNNS